MRILLVGAHGTIGKAVTAELGGRHQIIAAGRSQGEVRLDLADRASIAAALAQVGMVDAIVSAAGNVTFGPLLDMTPQQWAVGTNDKLMGQVNLALLGSAHLSDGGSITLTGGLLAQSPIRLGASASLVNAALEGFVLSAALELPRGQRINVVSPGVLEESMPGYAPYFRGFEAVPGARVARSYSRSVEGGDTGKVYAAL